MTVAVQAFLEALARHGDHGALAFADLDAGREPQPSWVTRAVDSPATFFDDRGQIALEIVARQLDSRARARLPVRFEATEATCRLLRDALARIGRDGHPPERRPRLMGLFLAAFALHAPGAGEHRTDLRNGLAESDRSAFDAFVRRAARSSRLECAPELSRLLEIDCDPP